MCWDFLAKVCIFLGDLSCERSESRDARATSTDQAPATRDHDQRRERERDPSRDARDARLARAESETEGDREATGKRGSPYKNRVLKFNANYTVLFLAPRFLRVKNACPQLMKGAASSEHSHGCSACSPARRGTGTHAFLSRGAAE